MTDWLGLAAAGLIALGLIFLIWWLIFETEGVYLGRGVVIWLYDIYANRYDDIKQFSDVFDQALLAQPIMELIAPHESPLVLDVATGTGRLPLALVNHPRFHGRIVGVDLSQRMLSQAVSKLDGDNQRISWLRVPAEKLPFADNTFDVVTCLESLEFMEHPRAVMAEMIRTLRPGGLLLITNRLTGRWMPGKAWTNEQIADLLIDLGLEAVEVELWQVDYSRVWGIKAGESLPVGARPLAEILRCPCHPDTLLIEQDGAWVCAMCDYRAPIRDNGVIDLAHPSKIS